MLHGCIDGFSRRLIWLEVPSFNKKLEIIGKFSLDAVRQLQSIPKQVKADDSTDHAIIQPIHILLGDPVGDNNSVNSFSIVPSTENQGIEAYWSKLGQDRIGWWQDFLQIWLTWNYSTQLLVFQQTVSSFVLLVIYVNNSKKWWKSGMNI